MQRLKDDFKNQVDYHHHYYRSDQEYEVHASVRAAEVYNDFEGGEVISIY